MSILDNVSGIIESAVANPVVAAAGGAVVGAGLGAGAVALASGATSSVKRRKTKSRIKHTSRGWKQDRKRYNKRQKWEVAYRKRKRKRSSSRRGVKYTKNGQPYIILKSGKARFIKKSKGGKR